MENSNPNTEKSEVNQSILPRQDTQVFTNSDKQVCKLTRKELLTPSFNKGHEYSIDDACPACKRKNFLVLIEDHKSEKDQPANNGMKI